MTDKEKTVLRYCSQCKGARYIEFEHGLVRLPCKNCQGTGSEEVALILKGDEQYAEEYDNRDDDNIFVSETSTNNTIGISDGSIGVTIDNRSPDEEATGEPELPKKRKARRKSSK